MSASSILIHVFLTGGTIDSITKRGAVVPRKRSIIPEYVRSLGSSNTFKFSHVCMKDSRDLKPADRATRVSGIEKSDATHFIITHGTYRLLGTKRELAKNPSLRGKVIVLVGAMTPLKSKNSDGPANIARAISEIAGLQHGIYLLVGNQFLSDNAAMSLH